MTDNRPASGRKQGRNRTEQGNSATRFQKGRSGNPHGRPKVEGEVRELAQRYGRAAIERLVELMNSENERVAVVAAQAVLDRAYGKPPQSLQLDGEIGIRGRLEIHE